MALAVVLCGVPFVAAPVLAAPVTAKPTVDSEGSSGVTPLDAVLEAKITPGNEATEYEFEYATVEAKIGTVEATTLGEGMLPGNLEELAAGPVDLGGGLSPNTTYYYRVVATNGTGTEDGKVESFTTATVVEPSIDGESVTGVTHTNAELRAAINPEYQETEYQFKLGTTTVYGLNAPAALTGLGGLGFFGDIEPGVNVQSELESQSLEALKPNTEYHYEAVAKNGTGTVAGLTTLGIEDKTFLTLPNPPAASTGGVVSLAPTAATISAGVNPDASGHITQDDTTYYVEYGGTAAYGKQTTFPAGEAVEACRLLELEGKPCTQGVAIAGEGTSAKAETVSLSGLEPGVTYHYRVVATNLNNANELHGTVYGETLQPQTAYGTEATFTTPATPPTLSGVSAQGVTQTGATIVGTLEANGLPTRWELQLGSTRGPLAPVSSGTATVTTPLSLPIGSLSPGTTYYYKLIAVNPDGPAEPEPEGSFTTAPAPASATPGGPPATVPYQSIAELNAKEALEDKSLPNSPVVAKTLTRAQKLTKALNACHAKKGKKRSGCEAAAHRKYGSSKKKRK